MTTINLHQNQQEPKTPFLAKSGNGGFIFSILILVATLAALVGIRWYVPSEEKKNEVLAATIVKEDAKIVELKSLEQIIDMQKRLSEIKSNLQLSEDGTVNKLEITNVLNALGSDLSTGVVVADFKYSPDKINVSFNAGNFSDAAKQILNFKKSTFFTNVELVTIIRKENVVICDVAMKVKQ
ncbi:MAG: PilN domain-containing protein [Candidatus Moranbacteria bacterium]|nr:PilN domain-containing protein [Candidatus Moranbacteria bacterium]